jgi:hypothetical protein
MTNQTTGELGPLNSLGFFVPRAGIWLAIYTVEVMNMENKKGWVGALYPDEIVQLQRTLRELEHQILVADSHDDIRHMKACTRKRNIVAARLEKLLEV